MIGKTHLPFLILFFFFLSCDDNENEGMNNNISGTWKLTETLLDPGDGSGAFNSIDSDKEIVISNDSTFTSNGNLCQFAIGTDPDGSMGVFTSDNIVMLDDCQNALVFPTYSFDTNGALIIAYLCIEPCLQKYERQ